MNAGGLRGYKDRRSLIVWGDFNIIPGAISSPQAEPAADVVETRGATPAVLASEQHEMYDMYPTVEEPAWGCKQWALAICCPPIALLVALVVVPLGLTWLLLGLLLTAPACLAAGNHGHPMGVGSTWVATWWWP